MVDLVREIDFRAAHDKSLVSSWVVVHRDVKIARNFIDENKPTKLTTFTIL